MQEPILNHTLYASFTRIAKAELVRLFKRQDWLVRKSSWTDYELINEWAVLELDGPDSAPLLHGVVLYTKAHWKLLTEWLAHSSRPYQIEVYQEDGTLIREEQRG